MPPVIPQTTSTQQAAMLVALCAAAPVQDAPLRAFHNDPAIKARDTAQALAHSHADQIVQGMYWEHGKGCDTGCHLHSNDLLAWETALGIPRIIGELRDRIFEGLSPAAARAFVLTVAQIPVGADLSGVYPRFAHWMLTELAALHPTVEAVADLYARTIAGHTVTTAAWHAAVVAATAAHAAVSTHAVADTAAAHAAHAAADAAAAVADAANNTADAAYRAAYAAVYAAAAAETAAAAAAAAADPAAM